MAISPSRFTRKSFTLRSNKSPRADRRRQRRRQPPSRRGRSDRGKALERVDGDEETLQELARMLLSEGPALLERIGHAIARGDGTELRRSAHTLKGSAGISRGQGRRGHRPGARDDGP